MTWPVSFPNKPFGLGACSFSIIGDISLVFESSVSPPVFQHGDIENKELGKGSPRNSQK